MLTLILMSLLDQAALVAGTAVIERNCISINLQSRHRLHPMDGMLRHEARAGFFLLEVTSH